MIRTKTIQTPGRTIDLTIPLAPLAPPCSPAPTGLAWFSDTTGDFTEIAEAAYLGATETLAPVLAVAKVLGETCGSADWTTKWTPASGSGGDPAIKTDGALLYVYQAAGSAAGELRVSAQCAGQTLGPIALTLLPTPTSGSGNAGWESKFGPEHWDLYGEDPPPPFAWDGTKWSLPITPDSHHRLQAKTAWAVGYAPKRCRVSLTCVSASGSNGGDWVVAILANTYYTRGAVSAKWAQAGGSYQIESPISLKAAWNEYIGLLSIGTDKTSEIDDIVHITNIEFAL